MRRVVLIAAAVAVVDQLTKLLVIRFIGENELRPVIAGFFSLVNWRNSGAAWGIFHDYNLLLAVVSVLTIFVLYLFRHSFQMQRPTSAISLGLIAGGIVGNVVDRIRLGHVVDFLLFYIRQYQWPAFNVADSAICCGVALYVIVSWRTERQAEPTPAS